MGLLRIFTIGPTTIIVRDFYPIQISRGQYTASRVSHRVCENGTEVVLLTSHIGGHNLYVNDICDGVPYDFIWTCAGNQGLYDTHQIMWDFMSRFSKEVNEVDA